MKLKFVSIGKKMKQLNKLTSIIDTSLIISTVITGEIYTDLLIFHEVELAYFFLLQQRLHKNPLKCLS